LRLSPLATILPVTMALDANGRVAYCRGLGPALVVREPDPTTPRPPKLLDRVREAIRLRHGSRGTEKSYVAWIRRFILFHGKRHPAEMGAAEVTRFLSFLAIQRNVADLDAEPGAQRAPVPLPPRPAPQSNGKIERWHGSLKVEAVRPTTPLSLDDARRVVGAFVEEYNTTRLHSAIGYVTPHDRLAGRHTQIWKERDRKLEAARAQRAARREQHEEYLARANRAATTRRQ
jgi:hypothetical protein